jgi:F-type H+-transporting ATPase subunit b
MEYQAFHASPWQHGSFWVFISIVIFAIIAGRAIGGALTKMLDARTTSVRAALDEAAALKAEAEALLADAKIRQAQAIEDAKQILDYAKAEAARLSESLAAEAKATAARREHMALERIAAAEAGAVKDVRAAAIDIATAASTAILRAHFGAESDAAMIDHAIAGVPAALRQAV